MIAMMKLFFPQQAALQAVDQRKDFGVGHFFLTPKKNARRQLEPVGVIFCSFSE
jgi:hypothetical protein